MTLERNKSLKIEPRKQYKLKAYYSFIIFTKFLTFSRINSNSILFPHSDYVILIFTRVYGKFLHDRFTLGLVALLRGVDANDHCSWCHYLSCIPTSKWSCNSKNNNNPFCLVIDFVDDSFLLSMMLCTFSMLLLYISLFLWCIISGINMCTTNVC